MKPVSPVLPGYDDIPEMAYAKDQPQYGLLPVVKIDGPEGQILTRWQPTEDERARIAAGQDVYLWVCTFGQPLQPLLVEVKSADEIVSPAAEEWPDVITS